MPSFIEQPNGVFPSVCPLDCPDQCGLLVHKKDGKIIKVEGDPNHPVTQGKICNKVRHMAFRLYDKNRLKYPLKRTGAKGEGAFKRISWEQAVTEIADRFQSLIKTDGPESILPYSFYGNMGNINAEGMDRRFFYRLGASALQRTICQGAGSAGYKYTMGASFGTDPEDTVHAKLIIFWGINAASTNMHQIVLAQQARKQGAKIIAIDVHKNQTANFADLFIPILPGTDGALALGMMHILFKEGLVNQAFLEEYTTGHHELRHHVRQYDPETVSKITGVPVENIFKLARLYGKTPASFIRIGNGLQHHDNGGMNTRAIACLPALTGAWKVKGGGAIKSNSSVLAFNSTFLQGTHLQKTTPRIINMNQIGEALLTLKPPIKAMFVYNSNPAVVAPEGNKVRRGLLRDDLFLVVHDLFLTETAAYADIVLPATSSFENMDFYTSYWHHYIQLQQPVIEPFGESKSNTEVFRLLAAQMGFSEPVFRQTDAELIEGALTAHHNPSIKNITFESLKKKHYIKAERPSFPAPGEVPTESGKIELFSKKLLEEGYSPLPEYTPLKKESGHPFLFVPTVNHNFLNSTFSNIEKHIQLEKEPRLHINNKDAVALGIGDGDMVRVWNERGEVLLTAATGDDVLPGVVVSRGLWAHTPKTNRLVNSLTPDRLSDMGGGAVFFSGRASVEKQPEYRQKNK